MKTGIRKRDILVVLGVVAAGLIIMISGKQPDREVSGGIRSETGLVLVIDPGHGGADGGATSGTVYESVINLKIGLKLDNIMGLLGIPAVMTRDKEELEYPEGAETIKAKKTADQKGRAELINGTRNAVLMSIHQNKFPESSPHGAQVFYSKNEGSREFAEITQRLLREVLSPENKRESKAISEDIYLLKAVECPAILVECGFISNPEELKLLTDEEYQTKIAVVLTAAYIEAYGIMEERYGKS